MVGGIPSVYAHPQRPNLVERFDWWNETLAACGCWFVLGDEPLGWSDPRLWRFFLVLSRHGVHELREYQVCAKNERAARLRLLDMLATTAPREAVLLHVCPPAHAGQIGLIREANARIRRDWSADFEASRAAIAAAAEARYESRDTNHEIRDMRREP